MSDKVKLMTVIKFMAAGSWAEQQDMPIKIQA